MAIQLELMIVEPGVELQCGRFVRRFRSVELVGREVEGFRVRSCFTACDHVIDDYVAQLRTLDQLIECFDLICHQRGVSVRERFFNRAT